MPIKDWPQADQDALTELFQRARANGLWFFHQGLAGVFWFSPGELMAEMDAGNFQWGAVNWRLRDPQERIDALDVAIAESIEARNDFARRFERARLARIGAAIKEQQ